MKEQTESIMLLTMIVSLTLCPAWTAENENVAVENETSGFAVYGPSDMMMEKRAQLGFHGMRGKKAAMGFQGMRGKKWMENLKNNFYYDDADVDKRVAMGFHGMRGKKNDEYQFVPFLVDTNTNLLFDDDDDNLVGDENKRAISGFHGMRGKKDAELNLKRAGFLGMRGKKDFDSVVDKRATMGFHGMRGKKLNELGYKRAQGFLGMRGKKDDEYLHHIQAFNGKPVGDTDDTDDGDLDNLLAYLSDSDSSEIRFRRATPKTTKTETSNG